MDAMTDKRSGSLGRRRAFRTGVLLVGMLICGSLFPVSADSPADITLTPGNGDAQGRIFAGDVLLPGGTDTQPFTLTNRSDTDYTLEGITAAAEAPSGGESPDYRAFLQDIRLTVICVDTGATLMDEPADSLTAGGEKACSVRIPAGSTVHFTAACGFDNSADSAEQGMRLDFNLLFDCSSASGSEVVSAPATVNPKTAAGRDILLIGVAAGICLLTILTARRRRGL